MLRVAVAEERIVGGTVVVMRDGQTRVRTSRGWADREERRPMAEDAVHRLASVTKPFATLAVLRLVAEGRLDLESPVTTWLPEFAPALEDGTRPDISLRQLLTHTAGLGYPFQMPRDSAYLVHDVSGGLDRPGRSAADNLDRLVRAPLVFAPGARWNYSMGVDVAGWVAERVTGRGLDELVRDLICAPLGLHDSGFLVTDRARLVTPYFTEPDDPAPRRMADDHQPVVFDIDTLVFAPDRQLTAGSYPSGGAGMVGTAPDVVALLEAVRTGTVGLPSALLEEAKRPLVPVLDPEADDGMGFGLGWGVVRDPAVADLPFGPGSLTWGGAYGHSWLVDPGERLTIVGLTNTAQEGMSGAFPGAVFDAVYETLPAGA